MSKQTIQKVYPLTPMQEGMMFHSMLSPESSSYFTQLELHISGHLDMEVLEKSINQLLRSYDILRTVFVYQQMQRPRQVVFAEREAKVHVENISNMDPQRQQRYLEDYKRENQAKIFNLAKDLLLRLAVFQLSEKTYQFIWSNHHILLDGWSLGILMKKLFQYYEAFRSGKTLPSEPERPYADYIKWLDKQDKEEALSYWEKRVADMEQPTPLPQIKRSSANEVYRNEEFIFTWDAELVSSIKQLASRYQVTAPNLFQALWGALLGRYNNTDDVVFGTVVSGRPSAIHGIENMVGLFINTIPVCLRLEKNATFADLFLTVQQNALEAEQYDYVPLYEIQNRSTLNNNLVNHLLAFENYPLDRELENGNFEERLGFSAQVVSAFDETNYDFNLIAFPGDEWTIKMMYNASVYDRQWIEKVAGHLTTMVKAVVHNPETEISKVVFLSEDEKEELLVTFNNSMVEYPREKTIQSLFEEQAERVPDNVAVVFNDQQISYRDLNTKANQMARVLREKNIGPDDIVAIMTERSIEMIVGMLAILKAGGVYLPIDPAYPSDRIQFMLEDSEPRLLLTQKHLMGTVDFVGETLDLNSTEFDAENESNLNLINSPDDLSYIIYTSGTTGKPKGTMISHRNVVRLLFNDNMQFTFNEKDTWTMFHSFCFDFSVWEMYGALLYGGKLVVVPKEIAQSTYEFRELLIKEKVTVLNQTPTAFSSLIQRELMDPAKKLGIRYVIFGGEALNPLMLKEWYEKYPDTKLINMYGITETTVHVTFKEIGEEEIRHNISNIGVPIPTLGCYILDKDLNIVPVGVVGELCVSGLGVARGYLHRPELTAQRFIDNPHKPGERLYRSGDLARFLPNGEMEYFGRMDHQVKIRGFRIELGEIEHQLLKMNSITEAAVLAANDHHGEPMLCAYFVADEELTAGELRKALLDQLPDYMVPAHFIQLPQMPLTSNGKLDRKALPEPEAGTGREEYQEPTNETEERLAEIWQEVLGVERVGITDDFFSLGGHSLKAMMLTSKIHQQFEREVPIKKLFERPTIRGLAEYLLEADEETSYAIEPASFQQYYPVSSAQKRMYMLSQLEGMGVSYNIPAVLLLEGKVDEPRLEAAFQALIKRHETLRTSFEMVEGALVQKIHNHVPFRLDVKQAQEEEAEALIRNFIRPFDLHEAPLVRAVLFQFAEQRHLLLIDMHHIISDGVSSGILVRDLAELYRGESLSEPKLHYKDFAVWQNNPEQQERLKRLEPFWLNTFDGDIPILDLPSDFPRPAEQNFAGERFVFGIDKELSNRINQLTTETGTTLYMFLLAAFNVFLSKYSSQEDIIVGSPSAGRTHAEIRDVPGMFVNTLALRSAPEARKTFKEFLLEVKETCLQAFEQQDYPFEELVEKLPLDRETNRSPLFNVMFNLQNMDVPRLQLGNLHISSYSHLSLAAKFDLTLEAVEHEGGIGLSMDYATALYTEDTIQRWSRHLLEIAEQAVVNPEMRLAEIDMLLPEERRQLREASGDTGVNYPTDQTIQSQFEEQALKAPDRVAVVFEEEKLTYRELDERANRLAHQLRERGVGREDAVALLLDRSVEMIVAILAVMKAGGAYLPIDPENPTERIQFILQDSRVRCLITEQPYADRTSEMYKGTIINIRDDDSRYIDSVSRLERVNQAEDLAYIIYTSGTTGKPKGVMIEHRQVLHLIEGLRGQVYTHYDYTNLNVALIAPFHFDASVQQIFASLLLGHTLFIVPRSSAMDGRALAAYYRSCRIDVTDGTPAHLQMLLAAGNLQGVNLRHMLIGGEAMPVQTVVGLLDLFKRSGTVPTITNVYGPTECCVDASAFDIMTDPSAADHRSPYVRIGKPLGNNRLYILDAFGRMQPFGVPGELCIAGDGVGRGYLNLPELTAEKFVADPFVPGTIMYRTGDLACRQLDGNLQFLGRIDNQVKIRGYRIELGEIESALQKHEHVNKTVVIAYSEKGTAQELCAYVTAEIELSIAELREWLSGQLPKYMVPSTLIQLESIPLTANGKVNRRALPAPDRSRSAETGYIPPKSDMERLLCLVWQDTLDMEQIGTDDNFFDLGGHSLKALVLIGNIQTKMNRDIPLKALFDRPTVRQLATYMDEAAGTDSSVYTAIEQVKNQEYYPVSSAQKRMYILQQFEEQGVSYNMPSVLLMEGDLDIPRLESALGILVDRHETLRTSFEEIEGSLIQKVHGSVKFQLNLLLGKEEEAMDLIRQFIRPFDLSLAPLFRAGILRLSDERHLLLIDTHHIIADGVSNSIFIKELAQLYKGETLPEPKLHYKDFTMWQNEPAQQEAIRKQERYWLNTFTGSVPELLLPTDFTRPVVQSFAGDVVRFDASKEITRQIHSLTMETGTTLHMVLFALFNVFLSKMSGQDEIVIGSVVAGRSHADIRDIPGMFVNTLAMRSKPEASKSFRQFLQEVKESSLQAIENQDYPFEELIGKLDLPRDISRNPLFNVMLTLENADKEVLQLDRLSISPYEMPNETSKFDLTLGVFESGKEIGLQFEYCTDLFAKETIIRWSGYLLNIMKNVVKNPDACLSEIEILAPEEKRQILVDWNRTEQEVPTDKTIHQLFEAQVLRTPDHAAVVYNGQQWSYRELNARANRLAHMLIEKGIRADKRVGIMVKPSLEMAAGVLAILKAGGAFVPIDPDYPEQRISYMLADSGAPILLTQTHLPVTAEFKGEIIWLDGEQSCWAEEIGVLEEENPLTATVSSNLAYIIYTSGTTGQPKGVMIEHHSLVNLCYWHNDAFAVTDIDHSAKYAGFGFDATVWELFPYWIAGAQIHIIDEAIRMDIVRLNQYFEENGITISFLPTQLCEQFMELENRSLRILLTGGDKLKRIRKQGYTLVNNYGPTESTVVATSTIIGHDTESIAIGRPITNTRLYILGTGDQVQPVGVAGELCIAGRGLSRGYINRVQETEAKFVTDPFVQGERMYRTGDLARWLADGNIEYLGRIDSQVKVRGFRIEISEIEVRLAQHAAVSAAVVTDIQDLNGNTALCAYVVTAGDFLVQQLKQDLARLIPEYMVPQYWVELDVLPMTPNGKVDRKALPKPDVSAGTEEYKEPRNEIEALLAEIWQEVVGLPRIGISDNFFALGGDSIKAIQMASRLYKHGWKLEMKDLFQHPTIEQVSPYLQRAVGKPADQGAVEGEVKLTPIQRWYYEKKFTDMHHWNQSILLHAPSGFDSGAVKETFRHILEHHDALRMIYTEKENGVLLYNQGTDHAEASLEVFDLRGASNIESRISDHANQVQSSIDLSQGPLLKLAIFQTEQGDHLLIVIHHLVVDGVSWRILLEDFALGYLQAVKGQPVVFQDKTNSFKDWAEELEAYANSESFLKQADYWRQIETESIMPLPKDNTITSGKLKDFAVISIELTEEETRLLLTQVHRPYRTEMNDILLCALGLSVHEWTGDPKVVINMEGHGREEIIPGMNVSRTVGWFTAQYPVVLDIKQGVLLPTLIKTTKESLRSIPDKGIGYGILRYLTSDEHKSDLSFSLEPEISFNYLGQFDNEVQTDFFKPSSYDMGHQISPEAESLYVLNYSGIVRGGRLILSCSFNKQQYMRGTITERMDRFKHHLLQIIHHCAAKEDQELTPSDFSAGDLQIDEMDDIFDVLTEKLG